jgi:hypothetical protein
MSDKNNNWIIVKHKIKHKNKNIRKNNNNKNILNYKNIIINNKNNKNNKNNNILCDIDNMKKILCNNILVYGSCSYGNKCVYAHSIHDQNINELRKKAYDIIIYNKNIISNPDKILYDTLLELTKVCSLCIHNKCPGGYNCKFGVFDKKYQVCYDDLQNGLCQIVSCNKIHLTNKGIKPINTTIKIFNNNDDIDDEYNDKHILSILNDNIDININNFIDSKLLDLEINKLSDKSDDSDDSIKEYLNDDDKLIDSCDESIFS